VVSAVTRGALVHRDAGHPGKDTRAQSGRRSILAVAARGGRRVSGQSTRLFGSSHSPARLVARPGRLSQLIRPRRMSVGACDSASRTWAMRHQRLRDTTAIDAAAPVSRPICGGARVPFRQSRLALTCSSERRNPPGDSKRVESGSRGATSESQPLSRFLAHPKQAIRSNAQQMVRTSKAISIARPAGTSP